ncbi:MAG TPA: hypothetical protein P5136_01615 [Methanofastidiosum sp.]|nr:hypothetical protein [Methanofastidiosum sp.]
MELISRRDQIVDEIMGLDAKGTFSIVGFVEKEALAKSRFTKQPTPDKYKKIRVLYYETVNLGHSYEHLVNLRRAKEGKAQDFQAQATYEQAVDKNGLLREYIGNDPNKKGRMYIRYYKNVHKNDNMPSVTKYFLGDGSEISEQDYLTIGKEFLKDFVASKDTNVKQDLSDEEKIIVRNIKLENVFWLKRGDFVITDLTAYMIELLKK